jgi:hypothetical protein
VRSVARLLLAFVFCVALTTSLLFTATLVTDTVESRGDWGQFEASMRHYSDRLEWGPNGSLVLHRAEHPVATFFAMFAGTVIVTLASAYGFTRLGTPSTRRSQDPIAS